MYIHTSLCIYLLTRSSGINIALEHEKQDATAPEPGRGKAGSFSESPLRHNRHHLHQNKQGLSGSRLNKQAMSGFSCLLGAFHLPVSEAGDRWPLFPLLVFRKSYRKDLRFNTQVHQSASRVHGVLKTLPSVERETSRIFSFQEKQKQH